MSWATQLPKRNRLTAVGIAFTLLLAGFVGWNLWSSRNDPRIEAIRKAGFPVTMAELNDWYPAVPDAENAALVYRDAFALLKTPNSSSDWGINVPDWVELPPRGQILPPEDKAGLSGIMARNLIALRMLYSAQALTRSRYPIDFRQGPMINLPHLNSVRESVKLLTGEALLRTANGETEKAVQSLVAAGHTADSLAAEPIGMSQLVRMGCWQRVVPRMERVINSTKLSDKQLAVLQKMLAEAEHPESMARALAGDRAVVLAVLGDTKLQVEELEHVLFNPNMPQTWKDTMRLNAQLNLLKVTGTLQKDTVYFLDAMATNIMAAQLPYPARFKLGQQITKGIVSPPGPYRDVLTGILLPSQYESIHYAEHTARIRVAKTALAVERFRLTHGNALPDSLDELVPAYLSIVPTDPCDGQPLRFKKLSPGYVIYSIGGDGKDDGGLEPKSSIRRPNVPYDITFIVER